MPQAAVGIFTWLGGAGVAATIARTVIMNVALAKISQALTPTPKREPASLRGNITGSVNYQQVIFGEVRTGGQMVTRGISGTRNEYLHIATCESLTHAGGIEGYQGIWIDDNAIAIGDLDGSGDVTTGRYEGMIRFRFYDGTQVAVDSILDSALTSQSLWSADADGTGCAYAAVRYERVEDDEAFQEAFPQWPRQEFLVRGNLVYDVRLDSTRGGSGTHRADDPTTWEWSDNSANVLATYLLMDRLDGGAGVDPDRINWTTVAAAANVCDETINGSPGIAKYTCNIGLNTGNTVEQNIEAILNSMQGALVVSGDIKIYAGDYTTPSFTITDDWIKSYEYIGKPSLDDLYNKVKATYTDPSQEYKPVQVVATDASYVTADDGELLPVEYAFPAINNSYRAQYAASIILKRSRYMRQWKLELDMRGRQLEPFDTVTLTCDDFTGVARVITWTPTPTGAVVDLLEEHSSIYDEPSYATPSTFTRPAAVSESPAQVTGAAATAVLDGINVSWTDLGPLAFSYYSVESHDGSSPTTWSEIWRGQANEFTDPLTSGQTRYYRIRARSPNNLAWGAYSSTVNATADNRARLGLNSSGVVETNKVVTGSITNAAVTAVKGSVHFAASATPALQNANVVTYAYNGGSGDIDITVAAGSKGAGGTTASWTGGTISVPNFNATYNIVAQFGNGIASNATAYLAYSNNTGATNVATNMIVGRVTVVAGGSGTGSGGAQITP